MTVTASAPTTAPTGASTAHAPGPTGLAGVLGSGDHKVVGRLWILASIIGLVATGVAGAFVSIEKIDVGGIDVIDADWFERVFTFHGVGGAFLFLMPLTLGVATAIVPLQLGASAIAFPRAAAAAFWAHLIGAGVLIGGYLTDGGPFGTDIDGVELYLLGLLLLLIAQCVAWTTVVTTVVTLRAPGITMSRSPLFSWSALIAGVVWLLTLPVVAGLTLLAFLTVRYGQDLFGGDYYSSVSWAFGQPAVYAFGIIALGVAADVVPVFAGTRHRQHRLAMGLIGAFGVLSVGAWALPGIATDSTPWLYDAPWIVVSFAIVVPLLALVGLWGDTIRRGKVTLASPLLYGTAAVLMLLVGVLAGAVQSIEPLETIVDGEGTPLYGTSWTSGVAHYVVLGATIALIGAVTYWAPKLFGKTLAEGPSRLIALVLLAGTVLLALPDLVAGLLGQQSQLRGVADNTSSVEGLNVASAIGGGLLLLAVVGWVLLLLRSLGSKVVPGDDPWRGHTLEWTTSSPPPVGNFVSLPEITSEAPLYDARHLEEANA